MLDVLAVQHLAKDRIVHVAQRDKVALRLVLRHQGNQIVNLTGRPEEDLALAVLDILLNVLRYSLSDAEVLHILRNRDAHLLGK